MRTAPAPQQSEQPTLETAWVEDESAPAPSHKRAIVVILIAVVALIASGVAAWVLTTPQPQTPAPQPAATQTARAYTASDYEENRAICREMYETRDLQLYWSCVVGDIRLGQETDPTVPLADLPPVRLAPKASLGGQTDITFAPDATARCYATGYCLTNATFNAGHTNVQVMFTRGDGDIMGIFVPTQDAPTVMTQEVLAPYMPTGAAPDPTVHQATLSRIHMGADTHAASAPSAKAPTILTVSVDQDRKRPRTGDAFATSSSPARAAVPATPPTKTANQSGTRNLVMSPTVRPSSYPPGEADPGRRPRPRTLGA